MSAPAAPETQTAQPPAHGIRTKGHGHSQASCAHLIVALLAFLPSVHAVTFGIHVPEPGTNPLAASALQNARGTFSRHRVLGSHIHLLRGPGNVIVPLAAPTGTNPPAHLPENLLEITAAARHLASLAPHPDIIWELGNEPDFYLTVDMPDRVAAASKAAAWGIRSLLPHARLLMGALAMPPGPFANELVANGAARYTEGWNLHYYGWAHDFVPTLDWHRRFIDTLRLPLPLWVTETGFAELAAHRASLPEELARQQTFHERMLASASGSHLRNIISFAGGPFMDRGIDFGLFDREGHPRPAFTASVQLIHRLRSARPLAWIRLTNTRENVGIVHVDASGDWWLMLWSPIRRSDFTLPPDPVPTASSIDTRVPTNSSWQHTIRVQPGTPWIQPGDSPGRIPPPPTGLLVAPTSAASHFQLTAPPGSVTIENAFFDPIRPPAEPTTPPKPPASDAPCPVIAEFLPGNLRADRTSLSYRYSEPTARFGVRLLNLANHPRHGILESHFPPSWNVGPARHAVPVVLAPNATTNLAWNLPVPATAQSTPADRWSFRWRDDRGSRDTIAVAVESEHPEWVTLATFPPGNVFIESPANGIWSARDNPDGTTVEISLLSPPPAGIAGLMVILPTAVALNGASALEIGLEISSASPNATWRPELITPDRTVFRHGDPRAVRTLPGSAPFNAREIVRISEFTPGLWSRAPALLHDAISRARYLRLVVSGLQTGDSLRIREFRLLCHGATKEPQEIEPHLERVPRLPARGAH